MPTLELPLQTGKVLLHILGGERVGIVIWRCYFLLFAERGRIPARDAVSLAHGVGLSAEGGRVVSIKKRGFEVSGMKGWTAGPINGLNKGPMDGCSCFGEECCEMKTSKGFKVTGRGAGGQRPGFVEISYPLSPERKQGIGWSGGEERAGDGEQ